MSGRLVGEVAEWLRTPAATGLGPAERAVLLVIAERAKDENRKMLRHRGDDVTLFDRIREVTGLSASGLSKALRRLAAHDLEVRIKIGTGPSGTPVFAYRGMAVGFHLPALPASVRLPEWPPSEATIPVDNPADTDAPEPKKARPTGRPSSGKPAPQGGHTGGKPAPQGGPSPSKDNPSNTSPSPGGSSPYGADVENTPPAGATPSGESGSHRYTGYEPTYREASRLLQTYPDLGGRFMAQAETDLPAGTSLAYRVIYAAELARDAAMAS